MAASDSQGRPPDPPPNPSHAALQLDPKVVQFPKERKSPTPRPQTANAAAIGGCDGTATAVSSRLDPIHPTEVTEASPNRNSEEAAAGYHGNPNFLSKGGTNPNFPNFGSTHTRSGSTAQPNSKQSRFDSEGQESHNAQAAAAAPRRPIPNPPSYAAAAAPQNPSQRPPSYAAAAATMKQRKQALFAPIPLSRRQYGLKDGHPSVSFSATEVRAGGQHLAHALVAKFSTGRPELQAVRKHFFGSGQLQGRASIGSLGPRHCLITYTSKEDANRALVAMPRQLGNSLFRLFRWSPDFSTRKESTKITTWIKLPDLLPDLFDQAFIEAIVSSFGYFLDVDDNTKTMESPSCARACVEIDLSSNLPSYVWIELPDNRSYWQGIVYEGKMMYCGKCKIHGHSYDICRKRKDSQPKAPQTNGGIPGDPQNHFQSRDNKETMQQGYQQQSGPKQQTQSQNQPDNAGWQVPRYHQKWERKKQQTAAINTNNTNGVQSLDDQCQSTYNSQPDTIPSAAPGTAAITDTSKASSRGNCLLVPNDQVESAPLVDNSSADTISTSNNDCHLQDKLEKVSILPRNTTHSSKSNADPGITDTTDTSYANSRGPDLLAECTKVVPIQYSSNLVCAGDKITCAIPVSHQAGDEKGQYNADSDTDSPTQTDDT